MEKRTTFDDVVMAQKAFLEASVERMADIEELFELEKEELEKEIASLKRFLEEVK